MCATLTSPGVLVTVTDESQYATSGQGTIPLIVLATQSNKTSPISGGGTAPYTVPSVANQLYVATSQQDLIQNFGNPKFYSAPGYELNEYGLWAAWSYLGIANQCYVLRADLDLRSLEPTQTEPYGPPKSGTYWFDTSSNTSWGVFRANGNASPGAAWNRVTVKVNDGSHVGPGPGAVALNAEQSTDVGDTNWPLSSYGSAGDVCVVTSTASNYFYENIGGTWYRIGSYPWAAAHPTPVTGTVASSSTSVASGSTLIINGNTVTLGSASTVTQVATAIIAASIANLTSTVSASNALVITNTEGGAVTIGSGTGNTALGLTPGTTNGVSVMRNNTAAYPDGSVAGSFWIKGNPANNGASWSVKYYNGTTGTWQLLAAPFYPFDAVAGTDTAAVSALTPIIGNVYVGYDTTTGDQQLRRWSGTAWTTLPESVNGSWQPLSYEAQGIPPYTDPAAGTNWYNNNLNVDIMVGDGVNWLGYRHAYPFTDAAGPQIAGSAPTSQSDGMTPLAQNDLWIDGSDLENYPMIYTWDVPTQTWNPVDNKDDTTPFGIIFADARQDSGTVFTDQNGNPVNPSPTQVTTAATTVGSSGTILTFGSTTGVVLGMKVTGTNIPSGTLVTAITSTTVTLSQSVVSTGVANGATIYFATYAFNSTADTDMAWSSFIDPDAPDAQNYPAGMMLWNTRYSTYNVKQYNPIWLKPGGFSTTTDFTYSQYPVTPAAGQYVFPPLSSAARWVTASANDIGGVPYMGRKAQRAMVVKGLAASIESNQDIRSEIVFFNLMAAPGYPELIPTFMSLNKDMKYVAFCVADTPVRLTAATAQAWAANKNDAAYTGEDGLTVSDDYTGVYYPWGLATNIDGTNVIVPPSAIALVTIAYNDQVAYPWYAPAGFNRGLVSNASSVGYVDTITGAYLPVILNQGQRDTLYTNNINPIAYIPNRGLVVYGQKTLDPNTTAMDRINVARLMNYIAYNLDNILKPFLFEPNTTTTRATVTVTVQKFLAQLVSLNGLYDFAVVCNGTNNTPATVDANELWVDVAVQPTIAIEFIYVPVRILVTASVT